VVIYLSTNGRPPPDRAAAHAAELGRVDHMMEPDELAGVLETYLSQTSNRMNRVMKQLSIVATVALPLIVIAGILTAAVLIFGGPIERWFHSRLPPSDDNLGAS